MAQSRLSLVALASATSANGTARNGATFNSDIGHPGTLILDCSATIVTGSVVAAFKLQGSIDGTTWVDIKNLENVATVTLSATGTVALLVPTAAYSFQQLRAVATLSGASTAAGDITVITYRYVPRGRLLV
jgi:hypothetical protein